MTAAIFELEVNKNADKGYAEKKYSLSLVIGLLFLRMLLFVVFQLLFFAYFKVINVDAPWQQSANWWPLSVTFTNVLCVFFLDRLLKRENKRFKDFYIFNRGTRIKDFLIMSGLLMASMPIAFLPNLVLGNVLFGSYMDAVNLFYRPLPIWAAWTALIAFPLTMPLGELTVYFGYVMPRLEVITKRKWIALVLPAMILSFQHIAMPLLFDWRFIIWRLLMFLPFALIIGLIIRWKPRLFPYILIGHCFLDLMSAVSVLMVSMQ